MLKSTTDISDAELAQRLQEEELRLANGMTIPEAIDLSEISVDDSYPVLNAPNDLEGVPTNKSFRTLNTLRSTSKDNESKRSSNSKKTGEETVKDHSEIHFDEQSTSPRGRNHRMRLGTGGTVYSPVTDNSLNGSQQGANNGVFSRFFSNLFSFSRLNDADDDVTTSGVEMESGTGNMRETSNQNVNNGNNMFRIIPIIPDADRDSTLLMIYKLANAVRTLVMIDAFFLLINCLFLTPLLLLFCWGPFTGYIASTKFKINYTKIYLSYYVCKILLDMILVFAGFFLSIITCLITFMIARYIYIYHELLKTCSENESEFLRTTSNRQYSTQHATALR